MKRTAADIRSDIDIVTQEIMDGSEDAVFPVLMEEGEDKVIACLHVLTRMHSEILGGKVPLQTAISYIKARERAIARLEMEVVLTMEAIGQKKIDRPDGKISTIEPKKIVFIDDEELIPEDFMVEVPATSRPDKKTLLELLQMGISVEGVRMVDGKTGLRYLKPKAIKGEE